MKNDEILIRNVLLGIGWLAVLICIVCVGVVLLMGMLYSCSSLPESNQNRNHSKLKCVKTTVFTNTHLLFCIQRWVYFIFELFWSWAGESEDWFCLLSEFNFLQQRWLSLFVIPHPFYFLVLFPWAVGGISGFSWREKIGQTVVVMYDCASYVCDCEKLNHVFFFLL